MDETFELPVSYIDKELAFEARLLQFGYIHKFAVDVNGQEILFEPDEERNYRAIVDSKQIETNKVIDVELLRAIARAIETILQ